MQYNTNKKEEKSLKINIIILLFLFVLLFRESNCFMVPSKAEPAIEVRRRQHEVDREDEAAAHKEPIIPTISDDNTTETFVTNGEIKQNGIHTNGLSNGLLTNGLANGLTNGHSNGVNHHNEDDNNKIEPEH